jgi:hypothetical protein
MGIPSTRRTVKTVDDLLQVFHGTDLESGVIYQIPCGAEVQLGAMTEVEGRDWIEVNLQDGIAGYVLGSGVRSHTAIAEVASPDREQSAALDSGRVTRTGMEITYGHALRIAWFLFWRSYLVYIFFNFDTAKVLGRTIRSNLPDLWVALPLVSIIIVTLTLVILCLYRWFIHQLLRKKFRRFTIRAYNATDQEPLHHITIWSAVKLWWLLTWRWWILTGVTGGLIGGAYGLFFLHPESAALPLEVRDLILWCSNLVGLFFALPLAVRILLRKPPRGFRIEIHPNFNGPV